MKKKRPFIILKWAETLDGFIAPKTSERTAAPEPFWITGPLSRRLVHQWRSEEQAILAGTNTVLEDNPKLNSRLWNGKSPIRVILDKNLRIPKEFSVFDGSITTIVLTEVEDPRRHIPEIIYKKVSFSEKLAIQISEVLYELNIQSILIEGGALTLQTFLDHEQWDEARVFTGGASFGSGLEAPKLKGKLITTKMINEDELKIIQRD